MFSLCEKGLSSLAALAGYIAFSFYGWEREAHTSLIAIHPVILFNAHFHLNSCNCLPHERHQNTGPTKGVTV